MSFSVYKPAFVRGQSPHYVTYKFINDCWIRYDDEVVERIKIRKSYRAYLLVYRRSGHTDRVVEGFQTEQIPMTTDLKREVEKIENLRKKSQGLLPDDEDDVGGTSKMRTRQAALKSKEPCKAVATTISSPKDNTASKKRRPTAIKPKPSKLPKLNDDKEKAKSAPPKRVATKKILSRGAKKIGS